MKINYRILSAGLACAGLLSHNAATADELKFVCYQDANECEVLTEMAETFKEESGHTVNVETVGYDVIREQFENQLQTDAAPDLGRVTNLGGLNQYYLDLSPYVDAAAWEKDYSATLPWFRAPGGEDKGIYGWMTQLTVTGPYVNVTMFEDAGVELLGDGATWDEWADALRKVKSELGITSGLAMDRTAHRMAGPAFSYGAKFFDDSGTPILVDDGFREFAKTFVGWHEEGLMQYSNAAPLFLGGEVAMHMSGSWMINNYAENIKDFEWQAVPIPCGPGGCGAMPGGSAITAFKTTKSPEAAAMFIDFMAREENAAMFASKTANISANQTLQKNGVDYGDASPAVSQALSTFAANAGKSAETTPQAYTFQGYAKNRVIYGIVPDYMTQAITGDMSLEDALKAIDADVAAKIAE